MNKQNDGYNVVHDLLSSAKSVDELTNAVNQSLQLMKQYNLDYYQQQKIEQFGIRCYNNIMRKQEEIARIQKANKIKK